MAFIGLSIKLNSKGPILFRQKRFGAKKKFFWILKFRTLSEDAPRDIPTHRFFEIEKYSTSWQKKIRRSSLDELPQLFNIFLGNMSFIGPRPALWNQDDLINERDKYRDKKGKTVNDIRPGLTGLAQINGRDLLSIQEKAKYDGEYLEKLSFQMDVYCFFKTIMKVFNKEGVR